MLKKDSSTYHLAFFLKVQIRVRLHCHPLSEEQFRPIIADNYYNPNHFWFELDHAQTSKLMSLLSSQAVASSASARQSSKAWKTLFPSLTPCEMEEEGKDLNSSSKIDYAHSDQSNTILSSIDVAPCLNESNLSLECPRDKQVVENDEKGLMLKKLEELVLHREYENSSSSSNIEDSAVLKDSLLDDKVLVKGQTILEDRNKDSLIASSDPHPVIAQVFEKVTCLLFFVSWCISDRFSIVPSVLILSFFCITVDQGRTEGFQSSTCSKDELHGAEAGACHTTNLRVVYFLDFFCYAVFNCLNKVKLKLTLMIYLFILHMEILMHFDMHYTCFYLGIIFGSLRVQFT